MRPLPISAETAVKLAEFMKVPLENLMHMPQHIMLQKLAEMAQAAGENKEDKHD
ncbi:MAG: YycC family protein [Candidatus Cohnella colombiensis]|uniref:YycC family protein n=1 Tax=Candidatus Cohnella colombiensis TaxID=3121368 RepID=A0AA95F0J0_9BACL|nr:MAG: YycC family protein [Cohnella sp.]